MLGWGSVADAEVRDRGLPYRNVRQIGISALPLALGLRPFALQSTTEPGERVPPGKGHGFSIPRPPMGTTSVFAFEPQLQFFSSLKLQFPCTFAINAAAGAPSGPTAFHVTRQGPRSCKRPRHMQSCDEARDLLPEADT